VLFHASALRGAAQRFLSWSEQHYRGDRRGCQTGESDIHPCAVTGLWVFVLNTTKLERYQRVVHELSYRRNARATMGAL
jgi:hypothetical protein